MRGPRRTCWRSPPAGATVRSACPRRSSATSRHPLATTPISPSEPTTVSDGQQSAGSSATALAAAAEGRGWKADRTREAHSQDDARQGTREGGEGGEAGEAPEDVGPDEGSNTAHRRRRRKGRRAPSAPAGGSVGAVRPAHGALSGCPL